MSEIATTLGALRRKRGISAVRLAAAAGVSRQTIHAIEAGTYTPNTAVALRLARTLECTVEELFALAEDKRGQEARREAGVPLPGSESRPGQAVQLCQVDGRLIASAAPAIPWYLPPADGLMGTGASGERHAEVQLFRAESDFANRLLIAGCDPAISALSRHAQAGGIDLVLAHRNSSQSLALLKGGYVHVAGTHLKDEGSGESNLPQIGKLFAKGSVAVISFAVWEEGIVTGRGNPKKVRGIEDFARRDISIVNREKGSGSRALLDSRLRRAGVAGKTVRGYGDLAAGHLPAAWRVQAGMADCCIATRAAARAFSLHFIPLVSERYDLVIRKRHLDLPRMQGLLDTLSKRSFRRELEGLGGYDTKVTGNRVL